MDTNLEKGLSSSERLSSVLGEGSLSGSPCNGNFCSTTLGDTRCKTCGRHEQEIIKWNQLSETERKIINIKNASEGFKIRQVISQEDRWRDLQKLKSIDNLTVQLSGSLGVKTRVLLHFRNDWRWLKNSNQSYWYRSLRIYHQTNDFSWDDALINLKYDLENEKLNEKKN